MKARSACAPGLVLGLILCVMVPSARADEGMTQEGLSLEDVARLQSVTQVATAPSGGAVAIVVNVPRRPFEEEDGSAWRHLHLLDGEGATRPYVTGEIRLSDVAWTADGKALLFLAKRGESSTKTLWRLPIDGGEAVEILALDTDLEDYSQAADGRLAVTAEEPADEERQRLEEHGFNQDVFEEDPPKVGVWVVDGDSEPRQLPLEGSARGVSWSPDGERLLVRVSPTSLVDDGIIRTQARVLDPETGAVVARVDNPGKLGDVVWSPDGKHLAMVAAESEDDPREGRLMVMASEGGALRDLVPGLEAHVTDVAWKDDKTVLALIDESLESYLAEVPLDGGAPRTVIAAGGPSLESMDRGADGRLSFVASTPVHPSEVYRLEGDGIVRRTNSNPWLADVRLAEQRPVRWTARDGLELEGLLIEPLDRAEGERVPLVMGVHGGPEAHYSNGWVTTYSQPGQVFAARGFAVFYPNYRASTGRGVAFSKMDHKDPAGAEFDDLIDGIDHLIESGLVDGERVGVTGGSYGGYATAWCATYFSHRFAAAVMSVGIADKIYSLGASDIPWELYQVHLREWPWEAWEIYEDRSPIRHVEKHRTPLLITHGDSDPRVHPGNSLAFYRFLEILDQAPVRLIWYPKEGHGNQRAASRYDYSLRLVRWMEHYLLGEGGEPPPKDLDYPLDPGTD